MAGYIQRTPLGAYCTACQSPLGLEEDDWDVCDACGGEGIGEPEEASEHEGRSGPLLATEVP